MFDRIMVIAPHCDDETLGCGGLLAKYPDSHVAVGIGACGSYRDSAPPETREEELRAALGILGKWWTYRIYSKEESRLDTVPMAKLVGEIEEHIQTFRPTSLFFPMPSHHHDHRIMHAATIAALRRWSHGLELAAMHEYPSGVALWGEPQSSGKMYVKLDSAQLKLKALECHESQLGKSIDTGAVIDMLRYRGMQCGEQFAECFYIWRMIC